MNVKVLLRVVSRRRNKGTASNSTLLEAPKLTKGAVTLCNLVSNLQRNIEKCFCCSCLGGVLHRATQSEQLATICTEKTLRYSLLARRSRWGVTLCNGSCKLQLRLLRKVEMDSTSCNVARNKKRCVANCRGTLLHRAILQQLATQRCCVAGCCKDCADTSPEYWMCSDDSTTWPAPARLCLADVPPLPAGCRRHDACVVVELPVRAAQHCTERLGRALGVVATHARRAASCGLRDAFLSGWTLGCLTGICMGGENRTTGEGEQILTCRHRESTHLTAVQRSHDLVTQQTIASLFSKCAHLGCGKCIELTQQ